MSLRVLQTAATNADPLTDSTEDRPVVGPPVEGLPLG